MNDKLTRAIALGRQGIPVFFCGLSKRPTLPGGFHNAVTDDAAIQILHDKAPGALIGVPTGRRFVVIDPDLQHRDARQWLKANKERLPVTRMHRTASGGWHILFRPRPDFRHGVTVYPKVDTRGLGGYIIWWPARGLPVLNPSILADCPDWMIETMPVEERPKTTRAIDTSTPIGAYLAQSCPPSAAFAGILRKMAGAKPGEKQTLAFWCANRTCELIRDGHLHREDALATLTDVALSTGLAPRRVAEVMRRVERTVLS
jgi:hypothetical protein